MCVCLLVFLMLERTTTAHNTALNLQVYALPCPWWWCCRPGLRGESGKLGTKAELPRVTGCYSKQGHPLAFLPWYVDIE